MGVTQLACREEGCPPLETSISLHREGRPSLAVTIHTAVSDLQETEAALAVRGALPGG